MTDTIVTVIASIKVKAGTEDRARELLGSIVPATLQEPGCIAYDLHQSLTDPTEFMFYERWVSDDALLVLMMIGPEDATGNVGDSDGTWQEWRQAVVDAKHDDLSAIVAAGIIGGDGCGTSDKHRLCKTILSFPFNHLETFDSVGDDYAIAFDPAAELALDACSLFVPG